VFGQNRSLFVPVASLAVQDYALNFFISSKWQRMVIWLATCLGLGRKVSNGDGVKWCEISDVFTLAESILSGESAKDIKAEHAFYAIRLGSKGPYQKTSLIAITQAGQPLFYAKVAVGVTADAMVDAESTCLQRLSLIEPLKGMVPQKLNSGKSPSGRAYFTTTVASTLKTNNQFQCQHEQFLSTLGYATMQWGQYASSAEAQFTKFALERLKLVLGESAHSELALAAQDILSEIGELNLPMVMAHRDFAPWNIRWHKSGIFVFDWEYAAEGANPLVDFFHFHLIQQALAGHTYASISCYALTLTLPALKFLQQYYPAVNWVPKIVKYLLLAYLVDLMLFYVDSDKKYDVNNPVLSNYLYLIKQLKLNLLNSGEFES